MRKGNSCSPLILLPVLFFFPACILAQGPAIIFDPVRFGDPIHTSPDEELVVTLKISNIGDETLEIASITAVDFGDGTDWINVGTYPANIVPGDSAEVVITLNYNIVLLAGPDPAGYDAALEIDHNAPSDKDYVHIHLTVASDFDMPQQGALNTTCKQLMVYNSGRLGGGNEEYSLDIPGDCDSVDSPPNALMYLNNASPVIAWHDGEQVLAYTTLYDQEFTEEGTFRPQSELHFYSGSYDMVGCSLSTSDSLFGVNIRLFAPKDGEHCFIIGEYIFYNWTPVRGADEVYLGLIADWDIPSDSGATNFNAYNDQLRTLWQSGIEFRSDNAEACGGAEIAESDRLGGIAFIEGTYGYDLHNAWTDATDPHRLGSGLDKEYLYDRMSTLVGYNLYTGEELFDLHTGITFERADFTARAIYRYLVAFVTTNEGEIDYVNQILSAQYWALTAGLSTAPGRCIPGDANYDLDINVGDAVFLIGYIFKGGPPPVYGVCGGDANSDCAVNVGDAVYIISYVFKGGPPPPGYWLWFYNCGFPE